MGETEGLADALQAVTDWFGENAEAAVNHIQKTSGADGATLSLILLRLGERYIRLDQLPAAEVAFRHALHVLDEIGDEVGQASAWFNLGQVHFHAGDLDRAAAAFQESLVRDQAAGQAQALEDDHDWLLTVQGRRGDLAAAERHLREVVALRDARGEELAGGGAFIEFGNLALQQKSFAAAEEAFAQARDRAERAGRPAAIGAALAGIGLALNGQARYEEAIAACETALALEASFSDRAAVYSALSEAHTLGRSDTVTSLHFRRLQFEAQAAQGDPEACLNLQSLLTYTDSEKNIPQAIEWAERARTLFLERGDRAGAARSLRVIGESWAHAGRPERAVEAATAALEEVRAYGDEATELEILDEVARSWFAQDRREEAARFLAEACTLARRLDDPHSLAENERHLAECLLLDLHLQSSLAHYEEAVAVAGRTGDTRLQARCLLGQANALVYLGQPAKVVDLVEEAQRIAPSEHTRGAHWILGHALHELGEPERAVGHFEQALRLLEQEQSQDWLPYVRENQAAEHLKLAANLAASLRAAGQQERSLDLLSGQLTANPTLLLPVDDSVLFYNKATSLFDLDRIPEAIDSLERAIEQARPAGNLDIARKAHGLLGSLLWNQGDQEAAYRHVRAAVDLAEQTLAGVHAEGFVRSVAPTIEDDYQRAVEICLRLGRGEEAFDAAERARSRALANLLAAVDIRPTAPLDAELQALVEEERRHLEVLRASHQSSRQGRAVAVEEAIERLRQIWDRLARVDPEYVALRRSDPVPLESVRRFLTVQPRPVVLVEHFLIPGFLVTFLLTNRSEELHVELTPLDEETLATLRMDFAREMIRPPRADARHLLLESQLQPSPGSWERHAALLIDPIAPHLREEDLVCFVPFGPFHGLPLHALPLHGSPLILHHPVAYCGSSTVLTRLAGRTQRDGRPVVAFGPADEVCSFEEEAQSIARLWGGRAHTGAAASRGAVLEEMGSAGLLHFACHGQFDPADPLASSLLLADGALTVRDLLDRPIAADLVTLSACESGVQARFAGDELLGMTHALFYAGAPSVLASLWKVDDDATLALMTAFYEELSAGTDKAEALRRAQIAVRERHEVWSHPYFWAGFALVGSWGRRRGAIGSLLDRGNPD